MVIPHFLPLLDVGQASDLLRKGAKVNLQVLVPETNSWTEVRLLQQKNIEGGKYLWKWM